MVVVVVVAVDVAAAVVVVAVAVVVVVVVVVTIGNARHSFSSEAVIFNALKFRENLLKHIEIK